MISWSLHFQFRLIFKKINLSLYKWINRFWWINQWVFVLFKSFLKVYQTLGTKWLKNLGIEIQLNLFVYVMNFKRAIFFRMSIILANQYFFRHIFRHMMNLRLFAQVKTLKIHHVLKIVSKKSITANKIKTQEQNARLIFIDTNQYSKQMYNLLHFVTFQTFHLTY